MRGHFLGVLERPAVGEAAMMAVAQLRLHRDGEEVLRPNLKTQPPARLDLSDRWDQCAIHCSCCEATFQSSALV
jgi:hypothetical protein